jgi:hypothetical protein
MPFSYTSSIELILPLATIEPNVVRGFHSARCSCCCCLGEEDLTILDFYASIVKGVFVAVELRGAAVLLLLLILVVIESIILIVNTLVLRFAAL